MEDLPSEAPPPSRYLNRELSLLDYSERVLARGENASLPLLERVRCLHFFARNLDDFFQIRVAGLKDQLEAAPDVASPDGKTPVQQLFDIRRRAEELGTRQSRLWNRHLLPELAQKGIRLIDSEGLAKKDLDHLSRYFRNQVFPVLTPLAVDPGHPFPYLSNFSLNFAVIVRDPLRRDQRFARLKVPPLLPRFVALPDGERFVPLESVIAANLQALFPGMEVLKHTLFRVTRDNDLEVRDSEADDLLVTIQTELLRQRRRARAVRLEVHRDLPDEVRTLLMRELDLADEDVYEVDGLLDLGGVDFLADLDRPDLQVERFVPSLPPRLVASESKPRSIFNVLADGDVLLHHPYDSFAGSVVSFIQQAAADPKVLAIKQTLYRTSGPASPIAIALAQAAEAGKQVAALVELKARGDEQANIEWAQQLEQSGVHVVYGLVGLKTHAKLTLVVRQEGRRIRRYVHAATGNYNPSTAKSYEDIGLLTCDDEIGADVSEFFNFLTGYSRQRKFRQLLVAPMGLRAGLLELIRSERKQPDGRIVIKVNNLTDQEIIDALYEAAQAGTRIDLIVRGMCCLRPGLRGLSDRIQVRSLVGHFLEHSRIFRFGSERRGVEYYVGSADVMDRNLDRRVEAVVPVRDSLLKAQLAEVIDIELADDVLAWELDADGAWHQAPMRKGVDTHRRLMELAAERTRLAEDPLGGG
ncbi:MAG: polyphosphate kinase 1 [Candidatus Dormibacteraeota bacterium]|uniref:Polyphosphate kinase n=1 Tax=Candidatus Dormiibacter inghamiae TaxID=3127013 RepID=A0A934NC69_9BACT|nr:polyphosphate kinase 1 [Candidatus Dormibacteraeota bacterium]MBJ7606852.1 polyphosphate kinase 1 [Candidatus Dormibacteraeota bacterium]